MLRQVVLLSRRRGGSRGLRRAPCGRLLRAPCRGLLRAPCRAPLRKRSAIVACTRTSLSTLSAAARLSADAALPTIPTLPALHRDRPRVGLWVRVPWDPGYSRGCAGAGNARWRRDRIERGPGQCGDAGCAELGGKAVGARECGRHWFIIPRSIQHHRFRSAA